MTKPPKHLQSLSDIKDSYDIFLFDLWGVVHNGKQAFDGAIRALIALKELGKPVYFLSNAPRRCGIASDQLVDRGVEKDLYSGIFTSGEDTFEHLRDRPDNFYKELGYQFYHMGPDKDKSLFAELPYQEVPLDEAEFVVNTGTINFEDTVEDYLPNLKQAAAKKLPMVCANPDLVVLYGDAMAICAGQLALEYEKLGGLVRYHGKPHAEIFEKLLSRIEAKDKSKVLMIGDSLRTDIKGANAAGIDSAFILSGIHQLKDAADAISLYQEYKVQPTYVMNKVEWA